MQRHVDSPWTSHIVLIGVMGVCFLTGTLIAAPFLLIAAALLLRSRMLLLAGFGLIVLFLVVLVFAGGIGGSVDGGLSDARP